MQSARLKRAGIVRCLLEARDFSHVRLHGVEVDINPITIRETGSLEDYLSKVDKYMEEKRKKNNK